MKIIVIGATGTIGKEIVAALAAEHEVIPVAHSQGTYRVDMASSDSIAALFEKIGRFDALICAAGLAKFASMEELAYDDYLFGLRHKLMGQVALCLASMQFLNDNGAVTLTSGILSQNPMPGSTSLSMVNAAIEGFVRAAQLEAKRGIRINCVSPGWVKETMEARGMDSSGGTPASQVAKVYLESIKSDHKGEILDVRRFI